MQGLRPHRLNVVASGSIRSPTPPRLPLGSATSEVITSPQWQDECVLDYVPELLEFVLTLYCVIDAIQSDPRDIRNLPKWAWILLILLVPVVGAVAWLVAGRPSRESWLRHTPPQSQKAQQAQQSQLRQPPRNPRGPDDDPDFLKRL